MVTLTDSLLKNIKMFLKSADLVFASNEWTSASVLYFKALFAISDYLILQQTGATAKDHSERFRLLEIHFPEVYMILNALFPIYRASYKYNVSKDDCEKVKRNVNKLIEKYKID